MVKKSFKYYIQYNDDDDDDVIRILCIKSSNVKQFR